MPKKSRWNRGLWLVIGGLVITGAAVVFASLTSGEQAPSSKSRPPAPAQRSATSAVKIEPLDPSQVKKGKAVYRTYCLSCHGPNGKGAPDWKVQNPDKTFPPPPHDSSGHTWHHADEVLYGIVRKGGKAYEDPGFKSAMPAFSDKLSEEQVDAVIVYLKSLWKPEERASQAQIDAGSNSELER